MELPGLSAVGQWDSGGERRKDRDTANRSWLAAQGIDSHRVSPFEIAGHATPRIEIWRTLSQASAS